MGRRKDKKVEKLAKLSTFQHTVPSRLTGSRITVTTAGRTEEEVPRQVRSGHGKVSLEPVVQLPDEESQMTDLTDDAQPPSTTVPDPEKLSQEQTQVHPIMRF
jgi:hypothetical protein